jgi:hypothetical protein
MRSVLLRGLAEIVRLRTADCRQAAACLPALAAGDGSVDDRVAAHVAQCLRCQAEVAAYRRILRHLRSLRDQEMPAPPGAVAAVLESLAAGVEDSSPGISRVLWVAYVGGITVATAAAGAAGVLVWMNRRRPGLAETG